MEDIKKFAIESPAFNQEAMIPKKFSAHGEDVNPCLKIYNIPPNTKSLALIVDDPDGSLHRL